jgi:hypothetical protein
MHSGLMPVPTCPPDGKNDCGMSKAPQVR